MALYRQVYIRFWNDPWVVELTPEQKYFYLYLLTNPKTSQCGIYEISIRQIENETGYNKETITNILGTFEACGKIKYSSKSNEICIINSTKYNYNKSPTIKTHIINELEKIKDKSLVEMLYESDGKYSNFFIIQELPEKHPNIQSSKPVDLSKKELILLDELLTLWGFNQFDNEDKRIQISSFLCDLKIKGLFDTFSKQFQAYREYKNITKEPFHGFDRFMGSEKERYLDGGWNKENWEHKLNKLKNYATNRSSKIKGGKTPL